MSIIDVEKVEDLLKSELSTYKISKETGITAPTLNRYRSGEAEIKNMRIETAEKLYKMALIEEQKILDQAAKIESDESESTPLDESSHSETDVELF